MAQQDHLLFFDARVRGEAIRMLYALAGKHLNEKRITFEEWPALKADTPLGQIPVLTTEKGVLCQSNVIARYVARKLGLVGSCPWNETLNDLVMETVKEFYETGVLDKIYTWKVLKEKPEPEDSEKVMKEVRDTILKKLAYIQSIAERKGKRFIFCDEIQLGDVWLYAALESSKLAFPDIMSITPWVKQFTANFEADEKMKKYLPSRPPSMDGV